MPKFMENETLHNTKPRNLGWEIYVAVKLKYDFVIRLVYNNYYWVLTHKTINAAINEPNLLNTSSSGEARVAKEVYRRVRRRRGLEKNEEVSESAEETQVAKL